jgi:DNA helicase HerA-like ATPase
LDFTRLPAIFAHMIQEVSMEAADVGSIIVGRAGASPAIIPAMANRHGLITGATGTGKTVTLQVIAEGFSRIGVPVFMADVKGDLAGLSQAGSTNRRIQERLSTLGINGFEFSPSPVVFWDVFGAQGHPVRATVSELGPLLLARLLELNETQTGVLAAVFKVADDQGLLLLDLKDLQALAEYVGTNAREFRTGYGNISAASVGTIQRGLLSLERQGAEEFFGEPALNLDDLLQTAQGGRGVINVLAADRLYQSPRVYSTLLLWLLSELFENLPEVGDREKPVLVFFFDEAHLLFDGAPRSLLEKIEQVVRLVRSKGVGVFFVTQNPLDIPDEVLGQLGNRVQHALRAYTPRDQKAVKAAASTFRQNPELNTEEVITSLGVGEALVSFLDEKGVPSVVQRTLIRPPHSRIGSIEDSERKAMIRESPIHGHYEQEIDRDSAYELLKKRADKETDTASERAPDRGARAGRRSDTPLEATVKSVLRSAGSQLGREIVRGVLGSIFGGKSR